MTDFIFTLDELPDIRIALQYSVRRIEGYVANCTVNDNDIRLTYQENLKRNKELLEKVLIYEKWGLKNVK